MISAHSKPFRLVLLALLPWFVTAAVAQVTFTPDHPSGIYARGEKVGWTVALAPGASAPAGGYKFTIKRDGLKEIKSGRLDLAGGPARIETSLNEPGMILVEITAADDAKKRQLAGAAVEPEKLNPVVPCPTDFDSFWAAKIKLLEAIPAEPVLTPGDSGREGVEYATIKMNNIGGAHVYGQLAKPARPGKFPAMLILQWASPPYPLQKSWVTDRAAEGWLVLNVEPHDVPSDMPKEFYAALPQMIKQYTSIYNDDRNRSYFLPMYLGDYRAADYLAGRPDWDGRTFLVMGTSMGGQQSLVVAGLHPAITHMIVHVPAGADSNALLHGRAAGYPNWDHTNPKVMETGLYFDTVYFASRIKARCLFSMGFVDETCPPVGDWTVFNQIRAQKEIVPLIEAPHNNLATAAQQQAYTKRSAEWLDALVKGREIPSAGN